MTAPRIGLALGGGGARGMAHIPVLQAFDDLGIKPAALAGTSIGALLGAGYASGMSGQDLYDYTLELFANRADVIGHIWKVRPKNFAEIFGDRGLVRFDAERVVDLFIPDMVAETFGELLIPLSVVAGDFYGWTEADITAGPLRKAVAASIALPVIFKPVKFDHPGDD